MQFKLSFGICLVFLLQTEAESKAVELQNQKHETHRNDNICRTYECCRSARQLLKSMDTNVQPCDNFYQFVCGGFLKSTAIPDDKLRVDRFSVINDKLSQQLHSKIKEKCQPGEPRSFTLAKELYRTCMDTNKIEEQGLEPLREILEQLGGWPVLEGDEWAEEKFNWIEVAYKFRKLGIAVHPFIDFEVTTDLKNNTKRVITLYEASSKLPRHYLVRGFEDKFVNAYYRLMVDIAVILGANKTRARDELRESLKFEMQLANISLPSENRRNATKMYNPTTLRDLQKKHPSIPWKEYINTLLPKRVQVDDDEVVIVSAPKYLTGVENLLQNTSRRVQANYMMWRAVAGSVKYLNKEIRARQLAYVTEITGKTEQRTRWKECVSLVSGGLSISVSAMYVREYFQKSSKNKSVAMVQDIRDTFVKIMKNVDWMDESTKKSAIAKAMRMSSYVGYPDELMDDKKIDDFYADLQMDGDVYLRKVLDLKLFEMDIDFGELRKPVNKSEWTEHAYQAYANAYYKPSDNSIQFPAGILQGTFFQNNRPKYLNYGSIGYLIGHEITHGFDDQGRQFDKDGNLVDWWSPDSGKKYLEKAQCIIDQYSNYTAEEVGVKLNGINTQGENIADNGGIKAAYIAYNNWVARHGPEPRLPGLKYTPKQMFWISAANTWCVKYRPAMLKISITIGAHCPGEFRVLGPFSNMPEFAKDFNCPIGSKMNPEKKCSVW